jgi:pseudouridine-5'-phosphate glycosidase
VVALETTLVTHGLPQPHGLRVAQTMEAAVRAVGAVPARIGILDGSVREMIETLGLPGGLVIANPIPADYELPAEMHDTALGTALDDARRAWP